MTCFSCNRLQSKHVSVRKREKDTIQLSNWEAPDLVAQFVDVRKDFCFQKVGVPKLRQPWDVGRKTMKLSWLSWLQATRSKQSFGHLTHVRGLQESCTMPTSQLVAQVNQVLPKLRQGISACILYFHHPLREGRRYKMVQTIHR